MSITYMPCIIRKCVCYPACRNKEKITCPILNRLFCHMEDSTQSHIIWRYMREYFPNLKEVYNDKEAETIKNVYGITL